METIKRFEPLFGKWYAEEYLGSGGFGRVYRVSCEENGEKRYACVKHIPLFPDENIAGLRARGMSDSAIDSAAKERLLDVNRELAIASRFEGMKEFVCYDMTETRHREDGPGYDVFILMELCENLKDRMRRDPLGREEAIDMGLDLSRALEICAEKGIVHRNIKPENVFVDESGRFRLGDFGSARIAEDSGAYTRTNDSAEYMAPEVFKGEGVGASSDLYSLGLLMYSAANRGRMPFEPVSAMPVTPAERERALYRRIAGSKMQPPADADPRYAEVVLKATSCDPAGRYASAADMNEAIYNLTLPEHTPAPAPEPEPIPMFIGGDIPQQREVIGEDDIPGIEELENLDENGGEPFIPAPAVKTKREKPKKEKPVKEKRVKEKPAKEKRAKPSREPEYDEDEEDEEEDTRRGGGIRAAITVTSIIAVIALLGIIALLGKKVYDRYFGGTQTELPSMTPEIKQDSVDKDLYHVTVYAKAGTVLVYETVGGLRQEYAVPEDGRMTFNINGTSLLPDEPIESTAYNAQPKILIKNEDGTLEPVPGMGYIALEVPPIELTLDREKLTSEDGKASVSGKVVTRGTRVTVNGEEVPVKEDGTFVYETEFTENGEYEIPVVAEHNRYTVYHNSVSVTVAIPEPPVIRLPWDLEDQTYSQRVTDPGDTVRVYGMIPAGARLEVSCENEAVLLSEPELSEDGSFSFNATLPEIGDYAIKITCTGEDGLVGEREMHVQRAPEWRPYVESAWAMTYDSLMRPSSRCYEIKGKAVEITQHGDFYIVVLETSDGNRLRLEYHNHYPTANTFIEGKDYKWIYGYSLGRDTDGMPRIYVWFVNDK